MAKKKAAPSVTKKHLARAERERRQSRRILAATIVVAVLAVGLIGYGLVNEKIIKPNQPVAVVNGEEIGSKDFQARLRLLVGKKEERATNAGQIANSMISEVLIRQEAGKRGIVVSEDDVDNAIYKLFGYYPDGTPTSIPTGTPDPAVAVVATQTEEDSSTPMPTATPYTKEEFEQDYEKYIDHLAENGINEADLRSYFKAGLYREKLLDSMRAEVPDMEDQVWAHHILVADKETAEEVLGRLKEGDDWEELAAEYSEDEYSKDRGGDLGWFTYGMLVPEFADVAFNTPVDEISDPVETSYGWHLIQVLGHEERPINDYALEQAVQRAFSDWMIAETEKADINIMQEQLMMAAETA
jgi:parvulin-like peptidyl-prolyl isomerase